MPHRIFAIRAQCLGDSELASQLLWSLAAHVPAHNFGFALVVNVIQDTPKTAPTANFRLQFRPRFQ